MNMDDAFNRFHEEYFKPSMECPKEVLDAEEKNVKVIKALNSKIIKIPTKENL